MRVLHIDTGREMRGGQWQVLRLLAGLKALGVESKLLARRGSPLLEKARKAGVPAEALSIGQFARSAYRYDLIHAHDAHGHTLGALIPRIPLIVARRVAFPIGSRWKYGCARFYIAVSEHVKNILRQGGVRESKIAVVHDGVPVLEPAHGTALLAPANPSDPQKGGDLAREAARIAGIPLKFSDNLERDLPGAGMLLYVTYSEGLGSAALLAMSAGVPVIASDVGGLREAIRHRENGILVENSAVALAGAIRELAKNPNWARHLGQAARQTIQESFTIDLMVQGTFSVYREVLS